MLVTAPVGFGKTTLVAQWRASAIAVRRFAWIWLEHSDNDPDTLWRHIVRALTRSCPELDSDELRQAVADHAPDVTGTVLPLLVNELAELSVPVALVLENYHFITDAACHDQVAFLLLHLPPSAQVVLVTRTVPPLPLARLRAGGHLIEIGAGDLQFGTVDAASLVRSTAGPDVAEHDLAALTELTEGWAAALYLAALSLRSHRSPSRFIGQFSGDAPFLAELMAQEVLDRQPPEIQSFLRRTAILGRFCAPLCDAVLESGTAADIIGLLQRDNLFLVPLDDTRLWFRYHQLFADLLRSRLTATEPDLVPALHDRASTWFQQAGQADDAIRHAVAAGDLTSATSLVAEHWYPYLVTGRVDCVRDWIALLGEDQVVASPLAAHSAVWAAALSGELSSARRWLPVIETARYDAPIPDGIDSLVSSAILLRAVFGLGGFPDLRAAAAAVAARTDPASPWHALAHAGIGAVLYFGGEFDPAAAQARAALQSTGPSFLLGQVLARTIISLIGADRGALDEAAQRALEAQEIAFDDRGSPTSVPLRFLAATATGSVYAARGQLQSARRDLERALQLRRSWLSSPWYTTEVELRLAAVRADLGDRRGAIALVTDASSTLASLPDAAAALTGRLERLQRRLATGQPPAAALADPLTERELAVLRLLRSQLTLREIGLELGLSRNTVKTHVQAIYRKLGVSSRSEAVQRGRRLQMM